MSAPESTRRGSAGVGTAVLAVLVSAALWFEGTGLHPTWWLTWWAPAPLLWLALRASARRASVATLVAMVLGSLGFARYLAGSLGTPVPLVTAIMLAQSAVVVGCVLLFRSLALRGRTLLAVLNTAAAWTGVQALVGQLTPFGSNGSLGNGQADALPVVQLAAVTGIVGVDFLIWLCAGAVAIAATPAIRSRDRLRTVITAAAAVIATLGWGVVRLGQHTTESRNVTVVAAHGPGYQPEADTPVGRALLQADLDWLAAARPGTTDLVVFPESDVVVTAQTLPEWSARFARQAQRLGATVVLGVHRSGPGPEYNTALVFAADGDAPSAYDKQHLVVGVEDGTTAGHQPLLLHGSEAHVGVAICADLGFPTLGRDYAERGAQLMAVPALDFDVDAWSQSRVQLLRGVESGFAMARSGRSGYLTINDDRGRVLAQARADTGAPYAVVRVAVPMGSGPTPYVRWGHWFGSFCLLLAGFGLLVALRGPRSGRMDPGFTTAPDQRRHEASARDAPASRLAEASSAAASGPTHRPG